MQLIPSSMLSKVSRQILIAKKNSPHIFFASGVIGSVASTVLACRATLKLSKTLDEIQVDVDNLRGMKENVNTSNVKIVDDAIEAQVTYPDSEWRKDALYVYTKAGLKIAKLYSPAIAVGVISVASLTGSHVQLARRNTALMAAYAAMQKAYEEYRDRVRKELGEEKELDIYHAAETKKFTDADGNEIEAKAADPNKYSPYAKFFDEGSAYWRKSAELNRLYVLCQQNYANNLLQARGHLFLNEVYDMLDVGRTTAGAVVGWVIGKEGDNYVNFGVYEAYNAAFVNGHERSMLLDFNVDGVIYDKL